MFEQQELLRILNILLTQRFFLERWDFIFEVKFNPILSESEDLVLLTVITRNQGPNIDL